MKLTEVTLPCLQPEDREQFILDNQWAFKYGAQQEFGMRDERCEEGEEVISRKTIEDSIDGENAEAYRIVLDGKKVGGVVLRIDKDSAKGNLELLFVLPEVHSKGIGQAAWKAVEVMHPEIKVWETIRLSRRKRKATGAWTMRCSCSGRKLLTSKFEYMDLLKTILAIGAGSFLGGAGRYLVSLAMKGISKGFPWATLAVLRPSLRSQRRRW